MTTSDGGNLLQRGVSWLVPTADYASMLKVGLAPIYIGLVSASIASGTFDDLGSREMISVVVSMGMVVFSGGACIAAATQLGGTPRTIAARLVVIYGILLALSLMASAWHAQLVRVFPPAHLILAGAVVLIGVAFTDVLGAVDGLLLRETSLPGVSRSDRAITAHALLQRALRVSKLLGNPPKVFAVAGVASLASRGLPRDFMEIAIPIALAVVFGCFVTMVAAIAATRVRDRLDPLWIRFGGGLCLLSVGISLLGPVIPGQIVIAGIELPVSLIVNLAMLAGAPVIGPRCIQYVQRLHGAKISTIPAGQRASSAAVSPLDALPMR